MLFYVLFVSIALFVCKCVLYYYHWVVTQLQLNISYHHIYHISYQMALGGSLGMRDFLI